MADIKNWLNGVTNDEYVWYIKRLSGNDTLANDTHQAGPYIPRGFLFKIFPILEDENKINPDIWFPLSIDSHISVVNNNYVDRNIRAVWYNNKLHGGTRNEARITNFGGINSPLLDPENTGALTVLAFRVDNNAEAINCRVWVCKDISEEQILEERIGDVEPGKWYVHVNKDEFRSVFKEFTTSESDCWLSYDQIPREWLIELPTGAEIIEKTVELRSSLQYDPDKRLLRRRDCEFEIFRSVESAVELPIIKQGFDNVDDFIKKALSILNSRKTRTGRSLELHARKIFQEEGLIEDEDFSYSPTSEYGKRPDFLFPTEKAYHDEKFPKDKLNMLAVKTTCKDRWRQVLNEADRIPEKYLLTLQEGISEKQFDEMKRAGVHLVVPRPLFSSYSKNIHKHLKSLEEFIKTVQT